VWRNRWQPSILAHIRLDRIAAHQAREWRRAPGSPIAVLSPLPLRVVSAVQVVIDLIEPQVRLHPAHSGRVKRLEDGAVAQTSRVPDTLLDDLICLVRREHVFSAAGIPCAGARSRRLLVQEMILARHPLKDTLDGLQSGVLRAEAEGAGRWSCGGDRASRGIVPESAA
jgi:hypothetical protein